MMGTMEIEEHIAALQRDGDLLAAAAELAGVAADAGKLLDGLLGGLPAPPR